MNGYQSIHVDTVYIYISGYFWKLKTNSICCEIMYMLKIKITILYINFTFTNAKFSISTTYGYMYDTPLHWTCTQCTVRFITDDCNDVS